MGGGGVGGWWVGGGYKNKMKPKMMLQQCEGMTVQYEVVEIRVELKIRDSVVLYMYCATKYNNSIKKKNTQLTCQMNIY